MTETLPQQGRNVVPSGGNGNGGFFAGANRLTGNAKLSQAAVAPRESWIGRTIRAAASMARRKTQTTFVRGTHRLCKGMVERAHLPKGGRISCQAGRVWITADGGGEDVVISCGEFRWFRPGTWLLIEAVANSEIIVES